MTDTKKPENPNAFPYGYGTDQYERAEVGMSLRDYFAAKAMQACIIASATKSSSVWSKILIFLGKKGWTTNTEYSGFQSARAAYETADEMLKRREL